MTGLRSQIVAVLGIVFVLFKSFPATADILTPELESAIQDAIIGLFGLFMALKINRKAG